MGLSFRARITLFLVSLFSLHHTEANYGCEIFVGSWVNDPSYNPLYEGSNCPFIDAEFNCDKRPDEQYLKYSWKPTDCTIPKFDEQDLLNKWKGKKIMFVGNSLSENMWESFGCMIHGSVPNAKTNFTRNQPLSNLTFEEHDVTIHLYRTPYLVDIVKGKEGSVLTLDSIEVGGNAWKGMDVLIFNTGHWWIHTEDAQDVWDYIRDYPNLVKNMDRLGAFKKGLTTWTNWVDKHADPTKTKVFFQGISPSHYQGREWNGREKSCTGQQKPLAGSTYPAGEPPEATIVKNGLKNVKTPVHLLDLTLLSQLKKDARPSTYCADNHGNNDCSHWCLSGLPDTWNQLLYAIVFNVKEIEPVVSPDEASI